MKPGEAGEYAATIWFRQHGWDMVRTQPPITILGMLTPVMVGVLKRFIPRLASFGHMVIARMEAGGIADFTGRLGTEYRACEVKEASGKSMPASRLAPEQRAFLATLPTGCAWVGVLWSDGKFQVFPFIEKGSYKRRS